MGHHGTLWDICISLHPFLINHLLQAINSRIITAASKDEILDGAELSKISNHMLVMLTTKNCVRAEIVGNMTQSQFMQGLQEPKCYWPYSPADTNDNGSANDRNGDHMEFRFDRYL